MQSAPLFLIPFAGVLLGIGFLFPIMWWCGFFGVALFLTFLLRARSLRQAGTIGGLVGVIWYFLVLAPTFLGVFPLDWFGIQNTWLQLFAIACTWFFAALVPAIGTIFFALAVYAFKQTNWKALIIVPSLWVISEWISASVVGFIGAGPSSLLGAHFTYGALGYLLANDSVLLQSASFGGIYALSFILVCIGTLVYVAVWQKEKRKVLLCGLSGLFLLWGAMHLLGFPGQDVSGVRPLSIAVISRYVAPELHPSAAESEVNFESVYQQIQLLRNIDVLVFPEDTAFLRDIQDSAHTVAMAHVFTLGIGSTSPLLIDTNDIRLDNGTLQSQVWYAKGMNDVVYGYKQMFMPFGEYMPYLYRFTLQSVGGTQLLNAITEVRGYAPGPVGGMGEIRGVRVAARFCDEVFSPTLYRDQVLSGANVLVNLSSQSWFHGSHMIYSQMQNVAKVRAVENDRWFVQSANMSPAFVLDNHGEVIAESEWNIPSVLQVPVAPRLNQTLYTKIGEGFVALLVVVVGMLFASSYFYKNR